MVTGQRYLTMLWLCSLDVWPYKVSYLFHDGAESVNHNWQCVGSSLQTQILLFSGELFSEQESHSLSRLDSKGSGFISIAFHYYHLLKESFYAHA